MTQLLIWVICIVVLVIILLLSWLRMRRKIAIEEVMGRTDEEKLKDINKALNIYGFLFDVKQDIVYSSINPIQRKFGYCKLYDELAPSLNMIIECEPIYFQYQGRRWLIEFWKGQYGMTTGGEVGVYVTDKADIDIPGIFTGTFYESVSDKELLQMQYILKKDGKPIIERKEKHWWLTGFDVGIFSKPEKLTLEIQITFPYWKMQKAFVNGLYYAGYKTNEVIVDGNMVKIVFIKPKTEQPKKYNRLILVFIQILNKFYCNLFNWMTRDFIRTLDKIDFLRIYYPILFRIIGDSKRARKLEKAYENIQSYINNQQEKEYGEK